MNMQTLLNAQLQAGLQEGFYPGAVAACGNAKEILALSFAGKIALDGPLVNRCTRYDMASLTKLLSPTMIALRYVEEGKLTLHDTLGRYFSKAPSDKRDITVFQLMTHTAGFPPHFRLNQMIDHPQDASRAIFDYPLDTPPGTQPHYSCMGYILLGKMLEIIGGSPLDILARDLVFAPLGMRRTGYLPEGPNIAATEIDCATGRALQGVVHDENARFLGGVAGNAGVFSCIDDMILFSQMLARGGAPLLSPVTLKKATCCYTPEFDVHRGLGFHLAGTPYHYTGDLMPASSFGHTGFTGTSLAVDPTTGFFVVLLSNRVHPTRENNMLPRFRRTLHNTLYAAYTKSLLSHAETDS